MRLNEIYGNYQDQVRFYVVYIREAHPDDGWRVPENLRQNDLQMPMLVDAIDNSVEESYIALPMRLYVIGKDSKIAFTGERGPFGFNPDTWEEAIRAEIGIAVGQAGA